MTKIEGNTPLPNNGDEKKTNYKKPEAKDIEIDFFSKKDGEESTVGKDCWCDE